MWVLGSREKVYKSAQGCEDGLHRVEEDWVLPFVVVRAVLCSRYALLKPRPTQTMYAVSSWSDTLLQRACELVDTG